MPNHTYSDLAKIISIHSIEEQCASAPLISGNEKVGVINAINKIETNFFDKEGDQVLSAIADEVALAVKHARLFEYVVNSYCKIRQGLNSCKGCDRPLKSWTPCVRHMEQLGDLIRHIGNLILCSDVQGRIIPVVGKGLNVYECRASSSSS